MLFSFFLLPCFWFLGIALQSPGVYVLGIVVPFFVTLNNCYLSEHRQLTTSKGHMPVSAIIIYMAMAAMACWALFPLANAWTWHLNVSSDGLGFERTFPTQKTGKIFESKLSSAWLVSSIFLIAIGVYFKKQSCFDYAENNKLKDGTLASKAYSYFIFGLLFFSFIWLCYLTFQHATGFEFREPTSLLKPEHRMQGGLYRVFGFYGHPLSVASVGLFTFAFFWQIIWKFVSLYGQENAIKQISFLRSAKFLPQVFLLLWGALMGISAVIESGGRTALLCALAICALVPFLVPLQGRLKAYRILGLGCASLLFFLVIVAGDIFERLEALLHKLQNGEFENRLYFWKTYWRLFLDSPWLGQGPYWLEAGLRENYYLSGGLGGLNEKFNAHNLYLETLASVGVLGSLLALFLLYMFFRLWHNLLNTRSYGPAHMVFSALKIGVLANLLHSFTQNVFFDSNVLLPYLGVFWVGFWLTLWQDARLKNGI